MNRLVLVIASLLGASGVALGAFGAHALRGRVDQRLLEVWEVGVRYHLLHTVALLVVALLMERLSASSIRWAAWLMISGVLIFSGSLYLMTLSGARWLGAVTPLGGAALIAGWLSLAWAAWREC